MMTRSKFISLSLVVLLGMAMLPLQSCETMKENSTASGAIIGGLGGAALGAAIDDKSGRGALIGGAIGAAAGAGIGLLAQRHFDDVKAREERDRVLTQAQANDQWANSNPSVTLPSIAVPKLIPGESAVQPGRQLAPGQEAEFVMVFESVGQQPYAGSICRRDTLSVRDEEQGNAYATVREFESSCDLPKDGRNRHVTGFPIPAQAPSGDYRLVSQVFDSGSPSQAIFTEQYDFQVIPTTAQAPAQSGLDVASNR